MSEYKTVSRFFSRKGPEDIERFVDKNLDITEEVYALLKQKNWTQKDLADQLGKTPAEVSRWLSGTHNLTLRSIAKLEAVLGQDLILTPTKAKEKYGKREINWSVPVFQRKADAEALPSEEFKKDKVSKIVKEVSSDEQIPTAA